MTTLRASEEVPDRPLFQLARAELYRAKRLRTGRFVAHGATLIIGVVGLWLSGRASYVAALLVVLSESAAWALRSQSRSHHQRAEQGKRIAELRRFYDPLTANGAESDFRRGVSAWACKHASESRFDDADYWDAPAGQGREPLRKAVREAAWWSWTLYDEGRKVATRFAVVSLGLALIVLCVFTLTDLAEAAEEVARITLLLVAGLISADALTVRADWASASVESRCAYQALDSLARSDADVFQLWGDYRVVTAGTEPIPQWIYDRHRDRLNVAWKAEKHES